MNSVDQKLLPSNECLFAAGIAKQLYRLTTRNDNTAYCYMSLPQLYRLKKFGRGICLYGVEIQNQLIKNEGWIFMPLSHQEAGELHESMILCPQTSWMTPSLNDLDQVMAYYPPRHEEERKLSLEPQEVEFSFDFSVLGKLIPI